MSESDTPLTDEWEQRYGRARHWTEFAKRLECRLRALERPGAWVQRDKLERAQFLMSVHAVATLDDIHDEYEASLYEVKEILNALLAAREER